MLNILNTLSIKKVIPKEHIQLGADFDLLKQYLKKGAIIIIILIGLHLITEYFHIMLPWSLLVLFGISYLIVGIAFFIFGEHRSITFVNNIVFKKEGISIQYHNKKDQFLSKKAIKRIRVVVDGVKKKHPMFKIYLNYQAYPFLQFRYSNQRSEAIESISILSNALIIEGRDVDMLAFEALKEMDEIIREIKSTIQKRLDNEGSVIL